MKSVLIFLWLFGQAIAAPKIDLNWVYVNRNLSWEAPPRTLEKTYSYADNAELLILYPTGKLARVSCTLHKDLKTHSLSICRGCGFTIQEGTWTHGEGSSAITSNLHWVYRPSKKPISGGDIQEKWLLQGHEPAREAALIKGKSVSYIPLQSLTNLSFLEQAMAVEGNEQQLQNEK